jgi:predicted Zn finger-like uncharacterized protein
MRNTIMRVICQNCSTEYEVPDAALAGRSRNMLCQRCGHRWRSAAPASEVLVPLPVAEAPVNWSPAPESSEVAAAPEDRLAYDERPAVEVREFLTAGRVDPAMFAPASHKARAVPVDTKAVVSDWVGPKPAAPGSKRRLAVILVVLVVIVAVLLAHRGVMLALPETAGFFRALGLK